MISSITERVVTLNFYKIVKHISCEKVLIRVINAINTVNAICPIYARKIKFSNGQKQK